MIPYLLAAEDVTYKLNRGFRKVGGAAIYNTVAIAADTPSTNCLGVAGFWLNGVPGSPSHKIIVVVDNEIHEDDGAGVFTEINAAITTGGGLVVNFSTFDDFIYIADDGGNAPIQWDQTTLKTANTSTSAPTGTQWGTSVPEMDFTAEHKNYLFGAGDKAAPSTLYFSPSLTASSGRGPNGDWLIDGGQIEVNPDDGDRILALASFRDSLFVFKGPYKGSIWRVTGAQFTDDGAGITDIVLTHFAEGIGCIGPNATFQFGNDIGFIWQEGAVHGLAATERFGDFEAASLSLGLNEKFLRERVNSSDLNKAWAINDSLASRALIGIPVDGSATVNRILAMDYRFDPVAWSDWITIGGSDDAKAAGYITDIADNDIQVPMIVGADGFLRKLNRKNKWFEETPVIEGPPSTGGDRIAMSPRVRTPYLSYGSTLKMKSLHSGSISARIENASTVRFTWTRDRFASQFVEIEIVGGNLLGGPTVPPELQFILGDKLKGTLGGDQISPL